MTLGDATPNTYRRPWAFAAVCVMVSALTLMLYNLADPVKLLPWYAATYLLIGACIFGPPESFRHCGRPWRSCCPGHCSCR